MPLTLRISPPRGLFAVNAIFPIVGMSSFSDTDENASWPGLKYPVNILRTIETGEFSAVHLIADPWKIGGRLALKCSSLHGCNSDEIARLHNEGAIQRMLTRNGSKYVIKCFAVQEDIDLKQLQLFLEYAENGSLFDMIEPGVGLDPICTQYYFKQLIDGLKYIHGLGIVHRDIKPENLLLMANGTLKISDFGMASVFKRNGVERVLHRPCGSEVYASPQVRDECYRAQPADIWSSGIVLVGMLTGEIPWDAAMMSCVEFSCWVEGTAISQPPWVRIPNKAMDLVKMILDYNEDTRATVHQILEHSWMNEDLKFGGNDHCISLHQRNSGKQAIAGCKYAFRLKDEIISQRHS